MRDDSAAQAAPAALAALAARIAAGADRGTHQAPALCAGPGTLGSKASPSPGLSATAVQVGESMQVGVDDEFGVYLDLLIRGAVLRLRWVDPGGSPAVAAAARGAWIGETAITQAQWNAATGRRDDAAELDAAPLHPGELDAFLAAVSRHLPSGWAATLQAPDAGNARRPGLRLALRTAAVSDAA